MSRSQPAAPLPTGTRQPFQETDFNPNGSIMTHEQLIARRIRRGQCTTCPSNPVQCFEVTKKKYNPLRRKKEPLTEDGRSYKGTCLICHPEMDPRRNEKRKSKDKRRSEQGVSAAESTFAYSVTTEVTATTASVTESTASSEVPEEIFGASNAGESDKKGSRKSHPSTTFLLRSKAKGLERQFGSRNKWDISNSDQEEDDDGSDVEGQCKIEVNAIDSSRALSPERLEDEAEDSGIRVLVAECSPVVDSPNTATDVDRDCPHQNSNGESVDSISESWNADAVPRSPLASNDQHRVSWSADVMARDRDAQPVSRPTHPSYEISQGSAADRENVIRSPGNGEKVSELRAIIEELLSYDEQESVVEILSGAMMESPEDLAVQEYGIRILWTLARKSELIKAIIVYSSALDAIIQAMNLNLSSSSLQEVGCCALWSLAVADTNRPDIARARGCNAVIAALVSHLSVERVASSALGAMKVLSTNSEAKKPLVEKDASVVVAQAMDMHSSVAGIQSVGCSVLSNLAVDLPNKRVLAVKAKEVDVVIKAMEAHPNSAAVQKSACFALKNFSFLEQNVETIKRYRNAALQLQSAARRYAEECQTDAETVLGHLRAPVNVDSSSEDTAHAALMQLALSTSCAAIGAANDIMREHSASTKVQVGGLEVLLALSRRCHSNKTEITQSEVLETIVRAMTRHEASSSIQEKGCCVLGCLAEGDNKCRINILGANGCDAIVMAMRRHHGNESVQAAALTALNMLSMEPEFKLVLEALDYTPVISEAMKAHSRCRTVRREGGMVLSNLRALEIGDVNPANV